MKKVYLYCGLFLLGATSFAQRKDATFNFGHQTLENNLRPKETHSNAVINNNQDRALNIVWTEDFSGGAGALETTNGLWEVNGAQAAYWTIATTAHPLASFGWSHAMTGRHMRWDSYNPNDGEVDFATTVVNGSITSPTIDLTTATNGAVLEFVTETMYCCNFQEKPWYVYVSQDNGTSWSPAIPIDFGVDRNVATEDIAHPMTFAVDISDYITLTPATVKIRIAWEASNADGNGQINTHYFWMLDNMVIYETPQYEIQHQKLWLDDINLAYEYGDIPVNQATTLTVQSLVKSIGSDLPTNFALEVTVFDATMTQVFTAEGGTLANPPLSLGDVDTMTFATTFDLSTLTPGMYDVRVVTTYDEADEVTSNDTLWRSFNITNNVLSHFDYDQPTNRTYPGGAGFDPFEIGAVFTINSDVTLHGINMFIANGTTTYPATTDAEVSFTIYTAGGSIDYLDGPYTFTLTPSMINAQNTFNLHQAEESYTPLQLTAGSAYVVAMSVLGGDVVWYGMNPFDEDNSGRLYDAGTWYLSGDEPRIALNFDESLSTSTYEKQLANIGQNRPNPFNNTTSIPYYLTESANVVVEFVDVTGKIVKTITPGNQDAGSYSITIDANELAEGVYFYTFTIGDQKVTKQMVVTK